jgi:hypothetical protein
VETFAVRLEHADMALTKVTAGNSRVAPLQDGTAEVD